MKPAKEIKTGNSHEGIVVLKTGKGKKRLFANEQDSPDEITIDWSKVVELVKHKSDNKSGFFDLEENDKRCMHREHNPPMHLYIPPGKGYRHVCPGCGRELVMYGQNYTM